MELKCQFTRALETKTGQGKSGQWEATDFLCEITGQYPKHPVFSLFNKGEEISGLKQGDEITVHFDLDSNEYQGKYYLKAKAFRVTRGQAAQQAPAAAPQRTESVAAQYGGTITPEQPDLPF